MRTITLLFTSRFITLTLVCLVALGCALWLGLAGSHSTALWVIFLLTLCLAAIGVRDLYHPHHAILRNFPIAARLRFLLENIRPELRQYFFEDDKDGKPFSRDERALVYQRAKMQLSTRPFGSELEIYGDGFEWLHHSIGAKSPNHEEFRLTVGGPDCTQPYSASVYNISAMSFGALSANAIRALNKGAAAGNFAHDTGEGGLSPYHLENGGDIIW